MHIRHATTRFELTLPQLRPETGLFTILFLAIALAPPVVTTLVLLHDGAPFASVQVISRALGQIILGGAGMALYVHWRLAGRDVSGWLTAAAFASATYGVPLTLLDLAGARTTASLTLPGTAELMSSLGSLVLVVAAARRVRLPEHLDPLALGMGMGLAAVVLHAVLITAGTGSAAHPGSSPVVPLATAASGMALAVTLARIRTLPRRAVVQLSSGVMLMVVSGSLAPALGAAPLIGLPLATLHIAGAALGAWATVALCRTLPGLDGSAPTVVAAPDSLSGPDWDAALAAEIRHYEETLHELRSTVAGLAAASRILHDADLAVPASDRARLEHMQAEEVGRLERLLAGEANEPLQSVALDEVIQPVVTSVRARGHLVQVDASCVRALGRGDHIAEAVHILLDNAVRHSEGSGVCLEIATDGPSATITVSDEGPGVPDYLVGTLFEWGTQRPGSRGRGIGLHIARRLMRDLGGTLELDRRRGPTGASFLITLPLVEEDVPCHAAS